MFLKMNHIAGGFALLMVPIAFAGEKGKHKGHGAHEHGHAKLNLVVEGTKLTAVLEAPSESIYGFEYEPKTEKDKKKRADGGEKLKNQFGKMLVLDKSLVCTFANTKLDLHVTEEEATSGAPGEAPKSGGAPSEAAKPAEAKESHKHDAEHSETHAEFVATCLKPLAGTKAKFAFRKSFPRLKEIKVQVISEAKQSGAEIENDKGEVSF